MKTLTKDEWHAAGVERYGPDQTAWRFRCASCGHVASVADYKAAGAPVGAVAFSCVGRYLPGGADNAPVADAFAGGRPCNYAGGGLFKIHPLTVLDDRGAGHGMFDFADRPLVLPLPRVVNLRKAAFDVYIGRAGKGQDGYFGNPYDVRKHGKEALPRYRAYLRHRVENEPEFRQRVLELAGKTLGCFCKPNPCHGDEIVAWLREQREAGVVVA